LIVAMRPAFFAPDIAPRVRPQQNIRLSGRTVHDQ
jgi:hypothetical protein